MNIKFSTVTINNSGASMSIHTYVLGQKRAKKLRIRSVRQQSSKNCPICHFHTYGKVALTTCSGKWVRVGCVPALATDCGRLFDFGSSTAYLSLTYWVNSSFLYRVAIFWKVYRRFRFRIQIDQLTWHSNFRRTKDRCKSICKFACGHSRAKYLVSCLKLRLTSFFSLMKLMDGSKRGSHTGTHALHTYCIKKTTCRCILLDC